MKYFVFVALLMMIAVQAFALPAAPAPEAADAHTGAAKAKRAVFFYSAPLTYSFPSTYYPSYYPSLYSFPSVIV